MATDLELNQALSQKISDLEEQLELITFQRDAITRVVPGKFSYLDAQLRYQYVSQEYQEWYQKPSEEIVGKTVEDLMGTEGAQKLQKYLDMALAGQEVHYEFTKRFEDGEERTMVIDYIPHLSHTGEVLGFFASCLDVTELKHLREALQEKMQSQLVGAGASA
ncbi:PAS domain-containing protein [Leptolyngbya sp. FACHB-671]|uniref:PAS domain-containing protein n=1 Tax=Leptolyngbya sp. FACHB-671 TaxID=2692812 RepID=UPI001685DDA0|nr:PAS domain-containing protein [Leptolyngbya sp. FACHB-671]MBD2070260.1 PAS domain-containing protein [Leptolyngbya sp. FACHB-671]